MTATQFNFTVRDKDDIVALTRLGVGQVVIGNLYGCSSGTIKKVLREFGEPPRSPGFQVSVRPAEYTDIPEALVNRIDDLLQRGRSLTDILNIVDCPLPQLLLCLSLSPFWSRCDKCHERLRDCDQSLWELEQDGVCGECRLGGGKKGLARKSTIQVSLNRSEHAVVQAMAKRWKMPVSAFVRRVLMELAVEAVT